MSDLESGGDSASVVFRDLRREDVPPLMSLQQQLFPVQYTQSFYDRLFGHDYFCLVGVSEAGVILAVASARVIDDPASDGPLRAYIMTLGVREGHRQCGLGTRAIEEIMRLLRRRTLCEVAELHVKCANAAAVAFYERNGFERGLAEDGLCRNHYFLDGRHWDAYVYTRSLYVPLTTRIKEAWREAVCAVL